MFVSSLSLMFYLSLLVHFMFHLFLYSAFFMSDWSFIVHFIFDLIIPAHFIFDLFIPAHFIFSGFFFFLVIFPCVSSEEDKSRSCIFLCFSYQVNVICEQFCTWKKKHNCYVMFLNNRAMAGGKSLSENYAFTGMHHIFDQHSAAGIFMRWFFFYVE